MRWFKRELLWKIGLRDLCLDRYFVSYSDDFRDPFEAR